MTLNEGRRACWKCLMPHDAYHANYIKVCKEQFCVDVARRYLALHLTTVAAKS